MFRYITDKYVDTSSTVTIYRNNELTICVLREAKGRPKDNAANADWVMPKKLSVRIAERTGRKTPSRNGRNRAAFLAVRDDVRQALDDGWPVKAIWETLHEERKITFSYPAFCRYVKRLVVGPRLEIGRDAAAGKKGRREPEQEGFDSVDKNSRAGLPGFTFNSTPKKEDLI
jgi:hypothetical protein